MINDDSLQRKQALDPRQSFIVQAPAGSGKTELLIQRLLVLLAHVNKPEEILAITFTKKASNEMKERICLALQSAMLPEPQEAHKKLTWNLARKVIDRDKSRQWHLIENPNQLRIQTIDSLCSYLTRQLPLLSHFGSQPRIADNPEYLYNEAVHEILTHIEEDFSWSESISRLLTYLDNDLNRLQKLLVNLLKRRDQWLPLIHIADDNNIKTYLENNIFEVVNEHLEDLESAIPLKIKNDISAIYNFCFSTENNNNNDYSFWQSTSNLLLTKDGSWRKRVSADIGFPALASLSNPAEKAKHIEFREKFCLTIEALQENENIRSLLLDIRHLPTLDVPDYQLGILVDLIHILKLTAAQLRVVFKQYGCIDFIENSLAANIALGNNENPTDLALALDYKIQHILVDEFQDTSTTQYNLLEKLTLGWCNNDGRTLFVVGDPMQSIYRFREAEVGLFIRMRENGIGSLTLTPITLSHNFRSTPEIVQWNNQSFKFIFPKYTNISTGAVPYSESISTKPFSNNDKLSNVKIHGFISPNDINEANHLIQYINDIKTIHPGESIAILVRSRTHLHSITPALKAANIPYCAIDIDSLASKQIIQDLLSLTCALLHPFDRIAWLSILRSPWCGLLLSDLLILAGKDNRTCIPNQMMNPETLLQLSPDGKNRVSQIKDILTAATSNRYRMTLRTWIESTWQLLGGPACLNHISELQDAKSYFDLLDKFTANDHSLHLDDLKESIIKLYADSSNDPEAVQIMTIHSAKGLEFDTVILPHLEKKTPNDDKDLLVWMEQPLKNNLMPLLLAPISQKKTENNSLYHYISRHKKIKLMHETDRLLYVATTRAKKRLLLSYTLKNNDKRSGTGSFLAKLSSKIDDSNLSTSNLIENSENSGRDTSLYRLSPDWKNPLSPQPDIASIHQRYEGFHLRNHFNRIIGNTVHTILQQISLLGMDWWNTQILKNQTNYISSILRTNGIPAQQLKDSVIVISNIIKNALNDERGKWILQMHTDSKSEYPISAMIDGKCTHLVIDRTFIDEHNVRWIIDYKTSSHHDKTSIDEFVENEKQKYQQQMNKYKKAFELIDKRPIKFGLYFPSIPYWREWE